MEDLNNLEKMFQTFMDATQELQKTQAILQQKVEDLTLELEEKNRELREKERLAEIGSMAAGIAHEIRNPLGGIELFASLIKRASAPKEQELCDKILSGVSRLNRIVEDLLHYAKDFHLSKERIPAAVFIDSVKDYIQPELEKKKIRFVVRIQDSVELYGDKVVLFQMFLNLLKNAVQATPDHGEILLEIQKQADHTCIRIEDTGEGVPEDIREKVFKPFFTTKSTGSGLGLAIVNKFVEAHEGKIQLTNQKQSGARFDILLPAFKV